MRVTQRQLDAYDYFHAAGLHEKGAAAPPGNFVQESGEDLDSTMFRAHPDASGGVAQALKSGGIAEWLGDRKTAYIIFSRAEEMRRSLPGGSLLNDLETQCDFVIHELQAPQYADLYRQLTTDTGRSVATLTANFMEIYERPSNQLNARGERIDGLDNRIAHANAIYDRVQLIKSAEGQPTPIPVPQPQVTTGSTTWIPPRPQVVITQPQTSQVPPLLPPIPTAPAGPPISASTAGRRAAGQDIIETTLAKLYEERAAVENEIAGWEDLKTKYMKFPAVPALDAPLALPKPDEPQPIIPTQRSNPMPNMFSWLINWRTTASAIPAAITAATTIYTALKSGQMPDPEDWKLLGASISPVLIGLMAKDSQVTGGTISAVDGLKKVSQPISVVDGAGSRYDPKTGKFLG